MPSVRRVVLVVLDGLRPDAIPRFGLRHCQTLMHRGAYTLRGRTVDPSVTATCMASLLTGALPERHGLEGSRFHIPRPRGTLHPLPRLLSAHAFPSAAFLARIPPLLLGVGHRIGTHLGFSRTRFQGGGAHDIVTMAAAELREQRRGLIVMHWPDADRAGHATEWMSDAYADAARAMDDALGRVIAHLDLEDPGTLLFALADHGGGGQVADHHDSAHPLDRTIPIMLAGGGVRRGELPAGTSLLDVPATICWALGIACPDSYAGRPLRSAFLGEPAEVAA